MFTGLFAFVIVVIAPGKHTDKFKANCWWGKREEKHSRTNLNLEIQSTLFFSLPLWVFLRVNLFVRPHEPARNLVTGERVLHLTALLCRVDALSGFIVPFHPIVLYTTLFFLLFSCFSYGSVSSGIESPLWYHHRRSVWFGTASQSHCTSLEVLLEACP